MSLDGRTCHQLQHQAAAHRSPQLLWIVLQDHQQVLGLFLEVTQILCDDVVLR